MVTERTTEVEVMLTEEQIRKVREATGMAGGPLKIRAVEDASREATRPQALLDCVVWHGPSPALVG